MKKLLLAGLLSLFAFPSFAMASYSCTDIKNNLRYGMRDINTNNEVSKLQGFLGAEGFLNSNSTGFFGSLTLTAVKGFQKEYGIESTGFVGPITRAKIKAMTCGGSTTSTATSTPVTISTSATQTTTGATTTDTLITQTTNTTSTTTTTVTSTTVTTTTPTVEFIGTPTLGLQYDSAGKESMLVGKATVKVTASSSPVVFTSTGVSGKSAFFSLYNATRGQTSGNYAGNDSPTTIPAGTSVTFTTTVSQSVKTLFAGAYTLVPEGFQYYADGAYLSVSKSSLKNARPSNSVTIIGETSPYITSAVYDTSSGNISISGVRFFNATANSVTMNGVTKVLPSANAAATLLTAVAKDFGITTSGTYSLQVSTSEGASNKVNVNVVVPTSVSATLIGGDISNSGTNQSLMKIRLTNNSSSNVIVNTVAFTLSSNNSAVLQDIMVTDSGGSNISGTLSQTSFPGDAYNYTAGLRDFEISANSSKEIHFRAYVESYTPTAGSMTITANWVSLGSDGSQMVTGFPIVHKIPSAYGLMPSSSQFASVLDAFSPVATPAPVSAPAPSWAYSWTRNLEIGSPYADDTTALQTALTKEGVFSGEVTGGFYTQTYLGVKAFQAKYGIESTGFVGPQTRAKLNELY